VDTQGFVLAVTVHTADIMDRDGIKLLIEPAQARFSTIKHIWLDAGYNGQEKCKDWLEQTLSCTDEIVRHPSSRRLVWDEDEHGVVWKKDPAATGFRVLPRRWVVERTFAWQSQRRRLFKDYQRHCATSEAFIYVAMTQLMARRLAAP
jgi:putative transposase